MNITLYYNTVMLKCIKIQIYKISVIILTHIYAPIVLRMSLHKAHILLNNGVAELAIPNTQFPQPAPCAVFMFPYRCTPKTVIIVV